MKPITSSWIKRILLLCLVIFISYALYLNSLVKAEFSSDIESIEDVIQAQYSFDDYPKDLVNMLLLVEDQSFFNHHGVDFKEILRVLYGYLFDEKELRGASTITQQLIKNSLLSRDQTLTRKTKESLMAILIELSYDKKFILERYMNTVYLAQQGSTAFHGFASGSLHYFNKDISSLNLKEMATLVALLKGPSYYNPANFPDRLKKRVEMILFMHKNYKKII
ncbi:transglycosylase domain-containing protein [Candidatus Thioglobus sp.]|jgi:membrane peptidoglycan carboxypeptidase|nr:biosynthetic peptidoglycan transglycosylase [Candidatus Thioglobus sp.]MDA9060405.1 transglycosylase domain-containing protein [Candidatus Thioglobus sp.]